MSSPSRPRHAKNVRPLNLECVAAIQSTSGEGRHRSRDYRRYTHCIFVGAARCQHYKGAAKCTHYIRDHAKYELPPAVLHNVFDDSLALVNGSAGVYTMSISGDTPYMVRELLSFLRKEIIISPIIHDFQTACDNVTALLDRPFRFVEAGAVLDDAQPFFSDRLSRYRSK